MFGKIPSPLVGSKLTTRFLLSSDPKSQAIYSTLQIVLLFRNLNEWPHLQLRLDLTGYVELPVCAFWSLAEDSDYFANINGVGLLGRISHVKSTPHSKGRRTSVAALAEALGEQR